MNDAAGGAFKRRDVTKRWVLDAPRELVWKAWTEPEQLSRWWGPRGITTPLETVEIDLRPGGVFRMTMVAADGTEFPTEMRYVELDPPNRLVYEWDAQRGLGAGVVTVTFTDLGDGRTEVKTQWVGDATDEIFAGAQIGWETQMEKLVALVAADDKRAGGTMGKVVVTEFVTLDGVIEGPGGGEDFPLQGWSFEFDRGEEGHQFKRDELDAADVQLLGRVTYEGFAKAWPDRDEDEWGFTGKMNSMPKYVVSTTLSDADASWNNTTVIRDDVPGAVAKLKQDVDGDVLIAGSATLVRSLAENDLVDEYRLMTFPVVLGSGKRLFGDGVEKTKLRLADSKPVGPDGVIVLTYEPARNG